MESSAPGTIDRPLERRLEARAPETVADARAGRSFPIPPFVLALAILGAVALPRVQESARLAASVAGAGAVLLVWALLLWARARRGARTLSIVYAPVKAHWVQGIVQSTIYVAWGWYWHAVVHELPLVVVQIAYLYAFDALLSWSRGRPWRLGFLPLPILLSTNLFMWFKDDWYFFQFAMISIGALGKEFIRWERDGKKTHVFNPSSFGLSVVSLVLIATGTTHLTWGVEIATTLGAPPHIYLHIFLLGLIVQYFFSVTLVTLSAAATLVALNLAFLWATGTHQFVDTNIPIAVFLGLHLLVTDPSTSPRTDVGRVIFGALYALATWLLYVVLLEYDLPEFYDKLLPVPILNLSVRAIERWTRGGTFERIRRWESAVGARKLNFAHMGVWVALFGTLLATGYVEAAHPGSSLAFWRKAHAEGKPQAGKKLHKLVASRAFADSPAGNTEFGLMSIDGELAPVDRAAAAHYFARGCELGDADGCANVAIQFLFLREASSNAAVGRALATLEQLCNRGADPLACYLVGVACETGRARDVDLARACGFYAAGCRQGEARACQSFVRIGLARGAPAADLADAALVLRNACGAGDGESCAFLAFVRGAEPRTEARAVELLERALALGSETARAALAKTGSARFAPPAAPTRPDWRRPAGE